MASRPDATAVDALAEEVVRPRWLAFLDIDGDPVRATTWPTPITLTGTGDDDLDDETYLALDPAVVKVTPVSYGEGGMDAVNISLSGLALNADDEERYDTILDPSNWQGRRAVLLMGLADPAYAPTGNWWIALDGVMVDMSVAFSAESQTIDVTIESYTTILTPASNRSYLDQSDFDPDDLSAAATIGSSNGTSRSKGSAADFGNPYGAGDGGWMFRNNPTP